MLVYFWSWHENVPCFHFNGMLSLKFKQNIGVVFVSDSSSLGHLFVLFTCAVVRSCKFLHHSIHERDVAQR